jgi:hypothetical protein
MEDIKNNPMAITNEWGNCENRQKQAALCEST